LASGISEAMLSLIKILAWSSSEDTSPRMASRVLVMAISSLKV